MSGSLTTQTKKHFDFLKKISIYLKTEDVLLYASNDLNKVEQTKKIAKKLQFKADELSRKISHSLLSTVEKLLKGVD